MHFGQFMQGSQNMKKNVDNLSGSMKSAETCNQRQVTKITTQEFGAQLNLPLAGLQNGELSPTTIKALDESAVRTAMSQLSQFSQHSKLATQKSSPLSNKAMLERMGVPKFNLQNQAVSGSFKSPHNKNINEPGQFKNFTFPMPADTMMSPSEQKTTQTAVSVRSREFSNTKNSATNRPLAGICIVCKNPPQVVQEVNMAESHVTPVICPRSIQQRSGIRATNSNKVKQMKWQKRNTRYNIEQKKVAKVPAQLSVDQQRRSWNLCGDAVNQFVDKNAQNLREQRQNISQTPQIQGSNPFYLSKMRKQQNNTGFKSLSINEPQTTSPRTTAKDFGPLGNQNFSELSNKRQVGDNMARFFALRSHNQNRNNGRPMTQQINSPQLSTVEDRDTLKYFDFNQRGSMKTNTTIQTDKRMVYSRGEARGNGVMSSLTSKLDQTMIQKEPKQSFYTHYQRPRTQEKYPKTRPKLDNMGGPVGKTIDIKKKYSNIVDQNASVMVGTEVQSGRDSVHMARLQEQYQNNDPQLYELFDRSQFSVGLEQESIGMSSRNIANTMESKLEPSPLKTINYPDQLLLNLSSQEKRELTKKFKEMQKQQQMISMRHLLNVHTKNYDALNQQRPSGISGNQPMRVNNFQNQSRNTGLSFGPAGQTSNLTKRGSQISKDTNGESLMAPETFRRMNHTIDGSNLQSGLTSVRDPTNVTAHSYIRESDQQDRDNVYETFNRDQEKQSHDIDRREDTVYLGDNSQVNTQRCSPAGDSKFHQKRTINVNLEDMTHEADPIQSATSKFQTTNIEDVKIHSNGLSPVISMSKNNSGTLDSASPGIHGRAESPSNPHLRSFKQPSQIKPISISHRFAKVTECPATQEYTNQSQQQNSGRYESTVRQSDVFIMKPSLNLDLLGDSINASDATKSPKELTDQDIQYLMYMMVEGLDADGQPLSESDPQLSNLVKMFLNRQVLSPQHYKMKQFSADTKNSVHIIMQGNKGKRIAENGGFQDDKFQKCKLPMFESTEYQKIKQVRALQDHLNNLIEQSKGIRNSNRAFKNTQDTNRSNLPLDQQMFTGNPTMAASPNSPSNSSRVTQERFATEEQLQDTLSKGHVDGSVIFSNIHGQNDSAKVPIKVEDATDENAVMLLLTTNPNQTTTCGTETTKEYINRPMSQGVTIKGKRPSNQLTSPDQAFPIHKQILPQQDMTQNPWTASNQGQRRKSKCSISPRRGINVQPDEDPSGLRLFGNKIQPAQQLNFKSMPTEEDNRRVVTQANVKDAKDTLRASQGPGAPKDFMEVMSQELHKSQQYMTLASRQSAEEKKEIAAQASMLIPENDANNILTKTQSQNQNSSFEKTTPRANVGNVKVKDYNMSSAEDQQSQVQTALLVHEDQSEGVTPLDMSVMKQHSLMNDPDGINHGVQSTMQHQAQSINAAGPHGTRFVGSSPARSVVFGRRSSPKKGIMIPKMKDFAHIRHHGLEIHAAQDTANNSNANTPNIIDRLHSREIEISTKVGQRQEQESSLQENTETGQSPLRNNEHEQIKGRPSDRVDILKGLIENQQRINHMEQKMKNYGHKFIQQQIYAIQRQFMVSNQMKFENITPLGGGSNSPRKNYSTLQQNARRSPDLASYSLDQGSQGQPQRQNQTLLQTKRHNFEIETSPTQSPHHQNGSVQRTFRVRSRQASTIETDRLQIGNMSSSNKRSPTKQVFLTKTKEKLLQGRCQTRFKFLGFKEKQGKSSSQQSKNIFVPRNMKLQEQFKKYESQRYEQELLQRAAHDTGNQAAPIRGLHKTQMTGTQWSESSLQHTHSNRGLPHKTQTHPLQPKHGYGTHYPSALGANVNGVVEEQSAEHSEFESHRMISIPQSKRAVGLGSTLPLMSGRHMTNADEILEEDKD